MHTQWKPWGYLAVAGISLLSIQVEGRIQRPWVEELLLGAASFFLRPPPQARLDTSTTYENKKTTAASCGAAPLRGVTDVWAARIVANVDP